MEQVSEAELEEIADRADAVSREAWKKLHGVDCTAALIVIGTLLAAVENELGWSRDRIIEHVIEIADSCTEDVH
jgi:hypothetical protein